MERVASPALLAPVLEVESQERAADLDLEAGRLVAAVAGPHLEVESQARVAPEAAVERVERDRAAAGHQAAVAGPHLEEESQVRVVPLDLEVESQARVVPLEAGRPVHQAGHPVQVVESQARADPVGKVAAASGH